MKYLTAPEDTTTKDIRRRQIEQFRGMAENSPDIIARFDRNFRYLYINRPVFNAKIGRIAARTGDSIDDIGLPEHEIELRKQKIRYVFETKQPTSLEFRFPGISGNQWFDARFVPEFAPDGTVASVLVISRDISRRKQTEDELQKTAELLNEAQQLARIGNWEWNLDQQTLFWSDEVYRIFGVEPDAFEPSAEAFENMIHPDDLEDFLIRREQMLAEKQSACIDHRIVLPDGAIRHVQERARLMSDKQGRICRIIGTVQDITERKNAEKALRESEKEYRTIFEIACEGICQLDEDNNIIMVNHRMADMLGYAVEEIYGRNLFEFIDKCNISNAFLIDKKCRQGISQKFEFCFRRKDGSELWAIVSGKPVMTDEGQFSYGLVMITDITDRKHYENMLRQNGERYRSYIETMNDGFVVFDKDMEVAYVNDKFSQITGYGKEELIGKTILHHFDEENLKIVKEQFEKRRKGIIAPYQVQSIRKDGSKIIIIISPKPIFDSDGNFQGSFATVADVTLRVETETMILSEHQIMKTQIQASEIQMKELLREIEEYNHALRVLLKNSQSERKEIEENVVSNVREMVAPFIDKLKNTRLSDSQKNFLDAAESNLNNIVSPFVRKVKTALREFTPMEIQVANLIREGRNNKEISDILTVSENTVLFHRKNIRNKLGLKHEKINLRTHLLMLV